MEAQPLLDNQVLSLRERLETARRQVALSDSIAAELRGQIDILGRVADNKTLQLAAMSESNDLLLKKYRRMRLWRPVAMGSVGAIALLFILK